MGYRWERILQDENMQAKEDLESGILYLEEAWVEERAVLGRGELREGK